MLPNFKSLEPSEADMHRDAALVQARALRDLLNPPPANLAPPDLLHAYATQVARLIRLDAQTPAAFRLGGTNAQSRTDFATETPFFGMLGASEVVEGQRLGFDDAIDPRVEVHFALALNRDLPPRLDGYPLEELADCVAWVAPALDICDTAFADPRAAGLAWMIADRCGAGRLVLGERMGADALTELEESLVLLTFDGEPAAFGAGTAIIGGGLGALREFLLVLAKLDVTLPADIPVSLGGCAPTHPLPERGRIEGRFGDVAEVRVMI